MYEYELEGELEEEFEYEGESEYENEYEAEAENEAEAEAEAFFGQILRLASRAIRSPLLRQAGMQAARAGLGSFARRHPTLSRAGLSVTRTALGGLGDLAGALGGPQGSFGSRAAGTIGSGLGYLLSSYLPEGEYEDEFEEEGEFEDEFEGELNPIRRVYPDAEMEHLGHVAAAAQSEAEAEAFIGALVPLAARALPLVARAARAVLPAAARLARRVIPAAARRIANIVPSTARVARSPRVRRALRAYPSARRIARAGRAVSASPVSARRIGRAVTAVSRVSPNLVRSAGRITRTLRRSPATRPLVRMMPEIIQRTTNQLGQAAARGVPVTPQVAVSTLAANANRVISSPQAVTRAYRRSRALDRRFHRARRLSLSEVTLRYN